MKRHKISYRRRYALAQPAGGITRRGFLGVRLGQDITPTNGFIPQSSNAGFARLVHWHEPNTHFLILTPLYPLSTIHYPLSSILYPLSIKNYKLT
jgi:hypothetical protein